MTRDKMFSFMLEHTKKCIELAKAKNADYSGASEDPFFNLRRGGEFGIAVRLDDKVSRLLSLLKPGATAQVKAESVDDTIDDIVNYGLLLRAMREGGRTLPDTRIVPTSSIKGCEAPGCHQLATHIGPWSIDGGPKVPRNLCFGHWGLAVKAEAVTI